MNMNKNVRCNVTRASCPRVSRASRPRRLCESLDVLHGVSRTERPARAGCPRHARAGRPRHVQAFALLVVLTVLAGGCNLAPEYNRPAAPVPDQWPTGPAYSDPSETGATDVASLAWPHVFLDPRLQQVIQMALENNRDLRLAALSVERARAMYGIQRSELLPVLGADASFTRRGIPADLSGMGRHLTTNQFGANLFLSSWELDFFGRIRNLTDRSLLEYLATEQARRSAQVLMISSVVNVWLTLAADRETLNIAETTLASQQAAYDLVKLRLDRGLVPELDLHRAQTQVDGANVDVARLTQVVAQDKNALDLLAGTPVPEDLLPAELKDAVAIQPISPGLSSEVLLLRPDILQAENQLKAAHANIGAARANLFPRITLTSALGTGSNELAGLFKSGNLAWHFSPQITMPIFDPRTWGAIKVTEVDRELAVTQYEKTIQTAFREVADTLAVLGTVDRQIAAQESLVHASEETYRLASVRYDKGVDNYLSVLDAQQALYAARQRLVTIRLTKIANQVRLYAVLGGGADSPPTDDTPSVATTKSR